MPYHDDAALTKARSSSDATGLLLQHGEPRVAAGVAVFGLGVVALPLLERCSQEQLLSDQEQRARLGALEPSAIASEIQKDWSELLSLRDLEAEVLSLQRWRDQAAECVAALERRSALAFLGLAADAEPEAVSKCYKQKALTAHPDKGGSQEDFQHLQTMLNRIQVPEDDKPGGGLFGMGTLLKRCKEAQKAKEEAEAEDLPEATKLAQRRLKLHDEAMDLWKRATEAQEQLEGQSNVSGRLRVKTASGGAPPCLDLLRRFIDGYVDEIAVLPPGPTSAERLFCRFLRQGVELLAAGALADAQGALSLVAMRFTGPLLQAARKFGTCTSLEERCQNLLQSLSHVPQQLESFLTSLSEGLADREAAEWRGCDEAKGGVPGASSPPEEPEEPAPAAPPRQCPFAAAVAAASAAEPHTEVPPPPRPTPTEALQRRSDESQLKQQATRPPREKYQDTEDWRKLRAFCIRARLCVNFNRDADDLRCTLSADQCGFKHACAVCGAEDRGGPGAQTPGWVSACFLCTAIAGSGSHLLMPSKIL